MRSSNPATTAIMMMMTGLATWIYGVIGGGIAFVLLAIVIIVIIVVRSRSGSSSDDDDSGGRSDMKPISVRDLQQSTINNQPIMFI